MNKNMAIFLLILTTLLFAQNYDEQYRQKKIRMAVQMSESAKDSKKAMDIRLEDGYIAIDLDETGEFVIGGDPDGASDYNPLTFSWLDAPGTNWTFFHIDDYDINGKTNETIPDTDSLYEHDGGLYAVWNDLGGLKVIEKASIDTIYSAGKIHHQILLELIFINNDITSHEAGAMLFFDTQIYRDDAAPIISDSGIDSLSTIFFAPEIPMYWKAYEFGYPPAPDATIASGFFHDFEAVMPDVFWFGEWGPSVGNGWADFEWTEDTGYPYTDSAMMMKWYQQAVMPGDTLRFATYYGIQQAAPMEIAMTMREPEIVAGCVEDEPLPFELEFDISNWHSYDIEDLELELSYSAGCLHFHEDSAVHSIDIVESGDSLIESWELNYGYGCRGRVVTGTLRATSDSISEELPFEFTIPEASDLLVHAFAEASVIEDGDTGIIHVDIEGGEEPIEFSVEPEEYVIFTGFGVIKVLPEEATVFHITVSDDAGCSYDFDIPITVAGEGLFVYAGSDMILCFEDSTELGGEPTALGGVEPITYSWTPTAGLDNPSSPNPMASPEATTTYHLTVEDDEGMHVNDSVLIIVSPEIFADAGEDTTVAEGTEIVLGGSTTGSGGSGTLEYLWSPRRFLDDPESPNPVATIMRDISYTVTVMDANGCTQTDNITIISNDEVEESLIKPITASLSQNTPNPFNPITRIDYYLPQSGNAKVDVYDIMGNHIANLTDRYHNAGKYSTIFDASDLGGGVYFYRLSGNGFDIMKKMVFVK
ncbi:MAG: T9SS type A sorting domain-containing protein [Candidatus Zixiibacteriota bacterium]